MNASGPVTAVGIDVGGARKGFHAVAITNGSYAGQTASKDAEELAHWCRMHMEARAIAIDAPCRWSHAGLQRPAEREMRQRGIGSFPTPTRQKAIEHKSNFYGWILRGEAMFQALEPTHSLCQELPLSEGANICFETFPHAVAWHLSQGKATASRKREQRRQLLELAGIDTSPLTNIDFVDAALCALVAYQAATRGECESYGEPATGLIIVPALQPAFNHMPADVDSCLTSPRR